MNHLYNALIIMSHDVEIFMTQTTVQKYHFITLSVRISNIVVVAMGDLKNYNFDEKQKLQFFVV